MGDRATVHFGYAPDDIEAAVYMHWAGDVPALLSAFLDDQAEAARTKWCGTQFDDPGALAARYVVWRASVIGHADMSIVPPRSKEGADYLVECPRIGKGRPTVTELPD